MLLDRGQGGRDILQKAGIRLHRSVSDGDVIIRVRTIVPSYYHISR